MEVLLYFGLPTKNEHDDFSRPQKFIAYPQPHEILKCQKFMHIRINFFMSILIQTHLYITGSTDPFGQVILHEYHVQ